MVNIVFIVVFGFSWKLIKARTGINLGDWLNSCQLPRLDAEFKGNCVVGLTVIIIYKKIN